MSLEIARSLGEEAGRRLRAAHGRLTDGQVDFKGRRDMVTAVDRALEEFLADRIGTEFPEDAILAEESIRKAGRSGRVWIVDPLDGTTNFVHGHPMCGISIALAEGYAGMPDRGERARLLEGASGYFRVGERLELQLGVLVAPLLGEVFWAERGGGAYLNDQRIRVSPQTKLDHALVATGFAYRRNEVANSNLSNFSRVALRAQGIRRGGSAALDLAYVAAGRFEAFWELYLKPWDVAAGTLLVREAGGRVTDLSGGGEALEGVSILASNGILHEAVRGLLEGPDPAWAAAERSSLDQEARGAHDGG